MKISPAFIIFSIKASFLQIQNDLNSQIKSYPLLSRTLKQSDMGLINRYGCWCYFQDDHGKGRSHPVDEIDEFCKILHHGYSCIIRDMKNLNTPCNEPWAISYNSAVSTGIITGMTMENLKTECNTQNVENSCESFTCMVENWFVIQYLKYSLNGGLINLPFRHENNFNVDEHCPASGEPHDEIECCGYYPERFPYAVRFGERDCCFDKTFSTLLYVCCEDGSIKHDCSNK